MSLLHRKSNSQEEDIDTSLSQDDNQKAGIMRQNETTNSVRKVFSKGRNKKSGWKQKDHFLMLCILVFMISFASMIGLSPLTSDHDEAHDFEEHLDEQHPEENTGEVTNVANITEFTDNLPSCKVRIINKADYHHEVIESAVLQYPVDLLNKQNCSRIKPIEYYFAL
eukprot:14356971-Ditylum_brightwellii.AAC.1